ncbi:MAG: hypothetical protein FIA92_11510 [Chloroflexi bacterium]|nr:hypothetical protein [Chloroflexota bacterium]
MDQFILTKTAERVLGTVLDAEEMRPPPEACEGVTEPTRGADEAILGRSSRAARKSPSDDVRHGDTSEESPYAGVGGLAGGYVHVRCELPRGFGIERDPLRLCGIDRVAIGYGHCAKLVAKLGDITWVGSSPADR